jgi:arabinose-5-phosphate isomerase
VFVDPHMLAIEALRVMNDRPRPIQMVFVCEAGASSAPCTSMPDLLRAGIA